MYEIKTRRTMNAAIFKKIDGTYRARIKHNMHYVNKDRVGDGGGETLRRTDKTLSPRDTGWGYDFAAERVLIPKGFSGKQSTKIKFQGEDMIIALGALRASQGKKVDRGLYGYSHVEYPDALGEGVDLIISPTSSGLAKMARFDASLAPLDIAFPIAGDLSGSAKDTVLIAEDGTIISSLEKVEVSKSGKKYLIKHIPELPITGTVYAQDVISPIQESSYSYVYFWNNEANWGTIRNAANAETVSAIGPTISPRSWQTLVGQYYLYRSIIGFDTSPIGLGEINSANLGIWTHSASDPGASELTEPGCHVLAFYTPTNPTSGQLSDYNILLHGDYDGVEPNASEAIAGPLYLPGATTEYSIPIDIVTPIEGLDVINPHGVTYMFLTNVRDIDNTAPVYPNYSHSFYGESSIYQPYLEVDYTPVPVAPSYTVYDDIPLWFRAYLEAAGSDAVEWEDPMIDYSLALSNMPEYINRMFRGAINLSSEWYSPASSSGDFSNVPEYFQRLFRRLGTGWA